MLKCVHGGSLIQPLKRFSVVELLGGIQPTSVTGDAGVSVSEIVYDSRQARPGAAFVAIKGQKADGHDFALSAARAGASAIVAEHALPGVEAPQFIVEDSRAALAAMSAAMFGFPSRRLKLTGITGTNGKTTTAYMLDSVYSAAGLTSGLIGTVEYRIAGESRPVTRTTPESYDLQKLLSEMAENDVTNAVMEVSSHAIYLMRIGSVDFAVKVFTNLSQDHLDFHGDMERYFEVKRMFMTDWPGTPVINTGGEYGKRIYGELPDATTYSTTGPADYQAVDIRSDVEGTVFRLRAPDGEFIIKTALPGAFNAENALATAAAARAQDIGWDAITRGLEELNEVPGRFERINSPAGFTVIVDYAHTPDGLAKAAASAKALAAGRLITVFGCGGDRDKEKRPLMGRAATSLSDVTIVTSDNPRTEKPEDIIEEIAAGCSDKALIEPDRREAIRMAVDMAGPGDIVLIAGKGHEKEQILKDSVVEFDDRKVAEAMIEAK